MTSPAVLSLIVDDELLDRIAERAAAKIAAVHAAGPEPWIGAAEAAAHLGCGRQRIYDLVHMRELTAIPHRKDGGRLLFRRSELDAWLEDRGRLAA